nr:putative G-protein coupled receptor [Biomphalaria glabrata]
MWGINETYELNTSSLILESNYTIQQNSPKNVLKTRFVITSVLMTFGLFGNTSIILVLKGFKGATSILTMYMAAFDSLSLISKVVGYGLRLPVLIRDTKFMMVSFSIAMEFISHKTQNTCREVSPTCNP